MKKIITFFAAVCSIIFVTAQVKIGVKGAWNYAGTKAVYTDVSQSSGRISGFGVGAMAKVPFDGVLHFSPSVMINNRGFIVNNPSSGTNKKEQYSFTYLDLIPALSAEFENGDNAFSITAGPVIGFTNFGKLKATDSAGKTGTQNLKFGYGAYGWFDLGFTGSLGYRFNKVQIDAGYYLGLANINNNKETDGRNLQHRVITVSIGYYFKQASQ
jgi:Outer membrane protein beta-barrel domain